MSSTGEVADETPTQRAARLRREKFKATQNGEERLAKIKQLNGGVAPPAEVLSGPTPQPANAGDPDEVDISTQNYGGPGDLNASANDPMFHAMMQMQQEQARQQRSGPRAGQPGQQGAAGQNEDPMARMLQQMMGMAGGDPNDPNSMHNTEDPMQMLSSLLNGGKSSQQSQARQPSTRSAYLWRITHAIFAMIIAGYIAATNTFDGSLLSRTQSTFTEASSGGLGSRLFLIFVTAELGLQSARFFMEGGQLQGGGMLATVANFAPEPYGGYVRTAGRWASILGSIVSDAMVVVFVLGCMAWWNGAGVIS